MKIFLQLVHQRLAIAICGWAVCFCAATAQAQDGWGTLKGQIVVSGDAPEMPSEKVDDHPDKSICLVDGQVPKDDNIVVDESGGLRDVFVMMYVKGKGADAPIHPSFVDAEQEKELTIDNVNCRFVPHALYVPTGKTVQLKNSDTVGHNCQVTTFNNECNVNLPAGDSLPIKFERSDKIPGIVTCKMHEWMDGVVLIRDNPYVAITDGEGKFEIKNVPAGEWEFQFWHNKAGYMKKLESVTYKFGRKGEAEVEITNEGETDMGKLEFPAKAFK